MRPDRVQEWPTLTTSDATSHPYQVHRWYTPDVGRYTRPDPLLDQFSFMGDQHPYLYVLSNPVRFKDLLGLYGTSDCSYYEVRCMESGGSYYCETAPTWCDRFPKYPDPDPNDDDDFEGWPRCTRKCLQDCDDEAFQQRKQCLPDPYPYGPDNPDPATSNFFDSVHTRCHARCYSVCYLQKWGEDPVLGRPLG